MARPPRHGKVLPRENVPPSRVPMQRHGRKQWASARACGNPVRASRAGCCRWPRGCMPWQTLMRARAHMPCAKNHQSRWRVSQARSALAFFAGGRAIARIAGSTTITHRAFRRAVSRALRQRRWKRMERGGLPRKGSGIRKGHVSTDGSHTGVVDNDVGRAQAIPAPADPGDPHPTMSRPRAASALMSD